MLRWFLVSALILALSAGFFGFGAISIAMGGTAKALFCLFLAVLVISLMVESAASRRWLD